MNLATEGKIEVQRQTYTVQAAEPVPEGVKGST